MKTTLVVTLIGLDKPGLVEMVSGTLAEHRASWQESSMSRLAGKFAGIMIANVDSIRADNLLSALHLLNTQDLKVIAEVDSSNEEERKGKQLNLELIGHDKPGIVRDISRVLAKHHVSVDHLETEVVSGSMSAELLFKAKAELMVPTETDLDELQEGLEGIASDLMVDIILN